MAAAPSPRRLVTTLTKGLRRWTDDPNDADPLCFVCKQPLEEGDAVELDGEPVHRDCARGIQRVAGDVQRREQL